MGFKVDLPEWVFSSEREDLSVEFMRLLAAAQEGGSSLAECWAAASRIDFSDDNSWYREWKKTADTNNERGNDALGKGNMLTARSNWLRAVNYYQAAAFPYDPTSQNHLIAIECMRECARKYLSHRNPAGEVVLIPWPNGYPLESYFMPAPAVVNRAPAVICIGEPGQRKEEYLSKVARYASDRGMSVLAVDLLGAGASARSRRSSAVPIWKRQSDRSWIISSKETTSTRIELQSSRMDGALPLWRGESRSMTVLQRRFVTAVSGI